jgi:hypothetical protein
MIVYRIENHVGQGPYRGNWCRTYQTDHDLYNPLYRPAPCDFEDDWQKTRNEILGKFWFGFKDIHQLHDWFPHDVLLDMEKDLYVIHRYKVPKKYVEFIPRQIAFRRNKAVHLDKVEI